MIDRIVEKLEEANDKYRQGNPIMSDYDYDQLLETLLEYDPENEYFNKVGIEVLDDSRKVKLPIPMFSMNKIKTMEEISDWCRLKGISKNEVVIITPKFDGLSLCVDEIKDTATTRGDGFIGQNSNEHYKLINNKLNKNTNFSITYGEAIMSKKVFLDKYSKEFANPRNLVAGMLNSKTLHDNILKDIDYIKYGGVIDGLSTKKELIDELNNNQDIKVSYHISKISDLSENLLIDLFKEWSIDYEIDGLIIEINNLKLQEELGRETSTSNPCFSRAFKHISFVENKITTVTGITWNISKQGLLKPVLQVEPINLDGVIVSNVTGNNAKFVKDNGLGIGSKVRVIRSGMVIPKIVEVLESVEFVMPTIEGVELGWNEAGIEVITLTETDEQKIKQIVAFFEILEADNVGEGVITQLWDAGFQTIGAVLNTTKKDLESIDRFGKRKATIVFDSIRKATTNVELSKLQHATGLFKGLGSLRLVKLEHFTEKPTVEQVMEIEGFAETSAISYVNSYDMFFNFIKDLPIIIKEEVEKGDSLEGKTFVFTGVRLPDMEKVIVENGGKVGSSISTKTDYLVCKDKTSSSSKMKKAIDNGVIIMDIDDISKYLEDNVN
jgi:NAD-dependent DNA ligase